MDKHKIFHYIDYILTILLEMVIYKLCTLINKSWLVRWLNLYMVAHYIICYQKITTNLYCRIENSIVLLFSWYSLGNSKAINCKEKEQFFYWQSSPKNDIFKWSKREWAYWVFNFHISTNQMLLLYITLE
jgi:hypothetical protein